MSDRCSPSTRPRGYSERKVETRELRRQRFLIVCEGGKTEPNYFRSFPIPKEFIDIFGAGDNTIKLVKKAIELKNQDGNYDRVWCVFDRDSFPPQQFNAALALAKKHEIEVAYSNEAFELWYLLHFHFYNTAISREDYKKMLSKLLGHEYKKNSQTIYKELESRQGVALKHARRLLEQYEPQNPLKDNPSTTVHLLVEQLNRFIR